MLFAGCSKDEAPEPTEVGGDISVVDMTPVSSDFGEPSDPYEGAGELRTHGDAEFETAIDGWWHDVATSTSETDLEDAIDRLDASEDSALGAKDIDDISAIAEKYLVADTTGVGREKFPEVFGGSISDGAPTYEHIRVLAVGADLGYVRDERASASALVAWVAPDETLSLTYVFFDGAEVIPEYEVDGWTGSPTMPTPISVGSE